jgi:hypothetical protein
MPREAHTHRREAAGPFEARTGVWYQTEAPDALKERHVQRLH